MSADLTKAGQNFLAKINPIKRAVATDHDGNIKRDAKGNPEFLDQAPSLSDVNLNPKKIDAASSQGALDVVNDALNQEHERNEQIQKQAQANPDGEEDPEALPILRADLEIFPGGSDVDGHPYWHIYDPLGSSYYQINYVGFCIISHWNFCENREELIERINSHTILEIEKENLDEFINFLTGSFLLRSATPEERAKLQQRIDRMENNWVLKLMKYIIFRKNIWCPDFFLNATEPYVTGFFQSKIFKFIFACITVAAFYLFSRQYEQYFTTFPSFLTPSGIIFYGIMLVITKGIHELGHAYTAKACGCRVPAFGLALLMFFPVIFTDVNETWRLPNKWDRFRIAAAGLRAELHVAVFALFLWGFLPPGPMKSACFVLSSLTWITSVIINSNPFLRFDGYYMFQELTGIHNLQTRAFNYAKWWQRNKLFGLRGEQPELAPPRRSRFMVLYAWTIWGYRFVIFTTIAYVMYQRVFKVLGILMMVLQIGMIILRPIIMEIIQVIKMRKELTLNRNLIITLSVTATLLALGSYPFPTSVKVPVMLRSSQSQLIYAPYPGRLVNVNIDKDKLVKKGEALIEVTSDELDQELKKIKPQLASIELRLSRQAASQSDRSLITVLREQREQLLEREKGLLYNKEKSIITAQYDGKIVDMLPEVREGLYVSTSQALASLVNPAAFWVEGYIDEIDLRLIHAGLHGKFIPESITRNSFDVTLERIDNSNSTVIDPRNAGLVATKGGSILVRSTDKGDEPESAVYRVIFTPTDMEQLLSFDRALRGTVVVKGKGRSFFEGVWRNILRVLIRESGF
jgi:putative peptide zinc metalloprotease protein